ncbi:hypothetical protein QAD02_024350 [Eretmocerus hayati]|uniref:Uncharacterized protein n=1 Tax=Eretmocerus hayati TaxID=131215 RepID=A0ACC2PY73_9HYME|nr:hypothetical protein QAD02_024350 [Eretmocerus hayati]
MSAGGIAVFLALLTLFLFVCNDEAATRRKRYLAFRESSAYFYKINYKASPLHYTTIVAQASGFKVAWPLPSGSSASHPKGRSLSRAEARESIRSLLDSHGFDGEVCLTKSLCQAMEYIREKNGILRKIFHILFRNKSHGSNSHLFYMVGYLSKRTGASLCGSLAAMNKLTLRWQRGSPHVYQNSHLYPEIGPPRGEAGAEFGERHARKKRYLIFPQGSNVQLVYCLTIGSYPRPTDLVVGLTAALAWELPSKIEHPDQLHRRSRSIVYPKIEAFLQSIGLDGRSCVMRALCEAGQRGASQTTTTTTTTSNGSFLQELLHAIFTIRQDGSEFESEDSRQYDYAHRSGGNCAQLYPSCEHSIYDLDL